MGEYPLLKLKDCVNYLISCGTLVTVISGFNGKVLAKRYKIGKDLELDERIVLNIRPVMCLGDDKDFAVSSLIITVDGEEEYKKSFTEKSGTDNEKLNRVLPNSKSKEIEVYYDAEVNANR